MAGNVHEFAPHTSTSRFDFVFVDTLQISKEFLSAEVAELLTYVTTARGCVRS